MQETIAVLAGTPVDTQMGVDVLEAAGLHGLAFPLAGNPWEQTAFQISSAEEKRSKVLSVLRDAQAQGCQKALVYCNSLSASVDFPPLLQGVDSGHGMLFTTFEGQRKFTCHHPNNDPDERPVIYSVNGLTFTKD